MPLPLQPLSPCETIWKTGTCGNNEVARSGDFPHKIHSIQSMLLRSPGLRGAKVPPPRVEALGSKGRRYGLHAPWGLSLRPLGIVPLPPKECLASPIGDIGTSDKLYLYQMEALTDPIMGFNRYEKRLQSVTKQWSVGNKTTVSR